MITTNFTAFFIIHLAINYYITSFINLPILFIILKTNTTTTKTKI
jgi:hypothetical protein